MSDALFVVCPQCRRDVPKANQTTHRLRCPGGGGRVTTTPAPPMTQPLPPPPPQEQQQPSDVVDLTDDSPVSRPRQPSTSTKKTPTAQQTPANTRAPPPPPFGPLSPPTGAATGEVWSCPFCTFQNEITNEVCGMCFKSPEDGEAGEEDVTGRVARVAIDSSGANSRNSRGSGPPASQGAERTWACPVCTFENSRHLYICNACETGRPRRQDLAAMEEDDEDDGFIVLPRGSGHQHARRRGPGQAAAVQPELQMLQNVLDGAILGAGAGGAHSIMTGANAQQTRQRMLSAMFLGGLGGGLFGNHVRNAFGGMGGHMDIDQMSYEDMLNVFGPGHVPQKASVESVTALPTTIMTEAELARLQRPDVVEGKDCLVCMEDFVMGDEMKLLPCTHRFHTQCIDKWLTEGANTCPVCKFRFEG